MIIWLASYPKSGNTWVRTIIGQILNNNFESEKVFQSSKTIRLYPSKIDFLELDEDFKYTIFPKNKKKIIFNKTVENWIPSQSKINSKKKTKIFKTHNMLCKIKIENKLYPFTNIENSIGVIHVVRDPRNVISSLVNHFSFNSHESALEFMINENQTIGIEENKIPQLLSSWKSHYNSWKRFPKNYLMIKYENLIKNPLIELDRIANYLKKFFEIRILDKDLNKILFNSSFTNLQKLEKNGLFDENAKNINTGEVKNFFNLGEDNDWKKLVNKETSNALEKYFYNEMKELDYL